MRALGDFQKTRKNALRDHGEFGGVPHILEKVRQFLE